MNTKNVEGVKKARAQLNFSTRDGLFDNGIIVTEGENIIICTIGKNVPDVEERNQ